MTTYKVTAKMFQQYQELLKCVETRSADEDGAEWGGVYLDNIDPIPGALANLKKVGLYRAYRGSGDYVKYNSVWGYVRLNVEVGAK